MLPPAVAVLYVPLLVWLGVGLTLLLAFQRSTPVVLLRLATVFLALWAILATTTLAWVLAHGGATAVVALATQPLGIFAPSAWAIWVLGGAGALGVFAVAFVLNQLAGRGLLQLLHPTPLRWPPRLPAPTERTSLLRYPGTAPEAFSFTLLAVAGRGRRGPHRHEIILLSDALLERLSEDEIEAVVAHELGHVRDLDARYLTFVRTLARMMRWDPVLAHLADSLTRREEYRADDEAVRLTRRPLALARALFKSSEGTPAPRSWGAAFLGIGGRRGREETVRRIERLLALAESGEFDRSEGD